MSINPNPEAPHNCPAIRSGVTPGFSEADVALLKHRLEELEERHEEQEKNVSLLLKYATVVDDIVKEQEARRKFWESIASSVTSAGAWAIVAAIGSAVWYAAQSKIGKP